MVQLNVNYIGYKFDWESLKAYKVLLQSSYAT